MRTYAAYYDNAKDRWKVIGKDHEGYWFNVIPDAGDMENAMNIAAALESAPSF